MSTKTAVVKQIEGISLAGRADSNHWVMMDGPPEFGGSQGACSPKELVLLALGGCTMSDVVSILRKKRVAVTDVEVQITAEQSDEHPKVYTKIHLEFVVRGTNVRPDDVARAIELSETKYCPVSAMLRPAVAVTTSYRVELVPSLA
jgi:putative redox protein